MAKSTSDKTKTTKTTAEKKSAAAKAATPEKSAPKKTAAKPKANTDPAENLLKKCQEAATKFDKMEDPRYQDIKEKLEWCIGSYSHDKNPVGLVEYGQKAVDVLKEVRADKPKQVPQKLVDDLEKALAKMS